MRALRGVWQAAELLASSRHLTSHTRRFEWTVAADASLYLEAEYARVDLARHEGDLVIAEARMRLASGWLLATEQDEAGIYIVARRKPLIGNLGEARIRVVAPPDMHFSLNLRHCRLCLRDMTMPLELPPSRL